MLQIRELAEADLPAIQIFTDEVIGKNYFSADELRESFRKSRSGATMCSFVLVDGENILGLRLAYPPGLWSKGKGSKLRPELWRTPIEKVAYFQSLFLAPAIQGQGWGPRLSEAAIQRLRSLGAEAIVTHAWQESPNNSSLRYLTKQGFRSIAVHPDYWVDVDYVCIRDGNPCRCTAEEMILYI